jgi:hypothetical protein
MAKAYLRDKTIKKKSASKAGWLIAFFATIFALLLGKFALSDTSHTFSGLPDSDAAYNVAIIFIQPTVLSTNISFSDSEYKFAKNSESVYVIKSVYPAIDQAGESSKTNFTITLKYNGGAGTQISNWAMLNLDQDN